VAVLLALAEAALWLLAPVGKRVSQRWEFDNQLPGLKERVSFTVDGRSLRSWKAAGTEGSTATGRDLTVLVLGGGGTMAVLQNDEEAWWGRLGTLLQQECPGSRIQVHALLRDHCTILQAAKWAEQNMEEVKPDLVVAAFGFEDVLSQKGDYTYSPDTLASLTLESSQRNPVKEFLVDSSQLCRRYVNRGQKRALMSKLGPLGERNAYAQRLAQFRQVYAQLPLAYEVERPEGRDPLMEYLDGIRALHALCQKQGASLAVVGEPTLHRGLMDGGADRLVHRWFMLNPAKGDSGVVRLDSGWIELELSRYFTAAEKLCGSLGVPFTDPTRKLPANPLVFVDDVMLTNSGATTLAKSVLPLVKPLVEKRLEKR
jgi:hypothetical protein